MPPRPPPLPTRNLAAVAAHFHVLWRDSVRSRRIPVQSPVVRTTAAQNLEVGRSAALEGMELAASMEAGLAPFRAFDAEATQPRTRLSLLRLRGRSQLHAFEGGTSAPQRSLEEVVSNFGNCSLSC